MPTKPDHLKQYIKEILLPKTGEDGFQLYKSKELLRVKGPFVDQISFQLSQYGSKTFYVHYQKNLIAYPLLNISSYRVGHRLSNNSDNGDESEWRGSESDEAKKAIISVSDAYDKIIEPWFATVSSVAEYVFEYFANNHDATTKSLEIAVAFAYAGKRNPAWWICSDLLSEGIESDKVILAACKEYIDVDEIEKQKEALQNEHYAKYHAAMADLAVPESRHDNINSLLNHWRQQNIEKFKLEKFIV
ncbi:MAG: hypothetical protein B6D77_08870 [gamma proteobacterium symbiont of Ctena orbiculata]|nr:MAG: hypothetical protein B6D77_08870 [gamma proteobacterium symbiont of Ctena orbiculata]PVV20395.1 MAG: hypothetical protein B6D78_10735 [gamma proteobacterium symbiont of Ctena orbiculata]PVV26891.1 MAG: hypothetical protein B6D79_04815 [gamma proteobacterium symbiont of Ctena orbiculata]